MFRVILVFFMAEILKIRSKWSLKPLGEHLCRLVSLKGLVEHLDLIFRISDIKITIMILNTFFSKIIIKKNFSNFLRKKSVIFFEI